LTKLTVKHPMKVKVMKIIQQVKNKLNWSYSFFFPMILSKLEVNAEDLNSNFIQFSYGILILSVVALSCFINILIYVIGYYLIQEIHLEKMKQKYPIITKFINRYKKVNLFFFLIEVLLCITCLLIIIFSSALFVYVNLPQQSG
ncbi:hypothetical protein K503DRAFT_704920, partial [Rhizopogon vinicolor AM-OR11-026]